MYRISKLQKYPNLFHAFSTKSDGNMANVILGEKVNFKKVLKNRKRFLSKTGVDINSCVCMWVKGEDGIEKVNIKDAGRSMTDYKKAVKIDALITDKKDVFILLLTADCAPVIIYDPVSCVVGVVHAGWKGVDKEIVVKVIERLSEIYKSKPEDLIAGIGPAARGESYIKENPTQKNTTAWRGFIKKVGANKYHVDFVGLCKKQLVDSGVKKKNIFDCGIDTVTDSRYFSHYRENNENVDKQGRFACVVGLR